VGVSNKPNSVSSVRCADPTSWKYKRCDFVPFSFQVSLHLVEDHPSIPTNKAANIFAHDPTRLNFPNDATHFGPQVAFVFLAHTLSCEGVGLARESSCEDINSSKVSCRVEFFEVSILYGVWEVVFEDLPWELFPLAVEDVLPAHPLGGEVKPSYT